ncbi:calcium-binding protein [Mesobacterium pallidum]|uniref:calcium-binding protein n=1 Tax=Mesobacterium pallidum TaxID=2872037 RepID=UPI001EE3740A|nr:calcium-binding protein [Mesobacterium pallidum]
MPVNPLDLGYVSTFLPLGDETQVNTYTLNDQENSDVVVLTGGRYVIAWESMGQDGGDDGIYAQMYNADGTVYGAEFLVPANTAYTQQLPQLVALNTGGFMAIWQGVGEIAYQRFDETGARVGLELTVNTTTAYTQDEFTVTQDDDGSFVVSWESYSQDGDTGGTYFQRFDGNGGKLGTETQLHTSTSGTQRDPVIAELNDGSYVGVWQSQNVAAPYEWGVYMQRYTSGGVAIGGETAVADELGATEGVPWVIALSGGGFVVGYRYWLDYYTKTFDASGTEVAGSTVHVSSDADGSAGANLTLTALSGDRFVATWETNWQGGGNIAYRLMTADGSTITTGLVHDETLGNQYEAEVLALPQGGFIVAFSSEQDGSLTGVYLTRFSDDGVAMGHVGPVEFQVNTETTDYQFDPAIALDESGQNLVVSWTSYDQDGNNAGVFAQRVSISTLGTTGHDLMDGTSGADHLAGWTGNDTLNGFAQHDILEGGVGADLLNGNWGDDTLIGGLGDDTGFGGVGDDLLQGGEGLDSLAGEGGNDRLEGDAGNDTLDGGAGADTMVGGTGSDVYIVDDAGDVIIEAAGEGRDSVESSISIALSDLNQQLEDLTLIGTGDMDGAGNGRPNVITGTTGQNLLEGKHGRDKLIGLAGDDTLDGGLGGDRMIGNYGNDLYIVNDTGDWVVEKLYQGQDTISANIELSLARFGQDVEHLELTGTADIKGSGNGVDNSITGNDGNNLLQGFGGEDTLDGGAGNDTLNGGLDADTFVFTGEFGQDTVKAFDAVDAEKIDLSAQAEVGGYWDLINNHLVDLGGEAQIVIGANAILLEGVAVADFGWLLAYSPDDFIFA